MTLNNWYAKTTGYERNGQGIVIDEKTGETIAVTYDAKYATPIAALPELIVALESLLRLHTCEPIENERGTIYPCGNADDVLSFVRSTLNKVKGE